MKVSNRCSIIALVLLYPCCYPWTHTHTHPFKAFFRDYQVSQYQKGKTNLDFTEARDSEWRWHQLGHMLVCTSLQTDNHATPHNSVFTGRMPFLPPNQQLQSTEGMKKTVFGTKCSVVEIWFCADWQSVAMPVSLLWLLNTTLNLTTFFDLVLHILKTAFVFIFLKLFSLYYIFLYHFCVLSGILLFMLHSCVLNWWWRWWWWWLH